MSKDIECAKYNHKLKQFIFKDLNKFNAIIFKIKDIKVFEILWDRTESFLNNLDDNLLKRNKIQIILKGFYHKLKVYLFESKIPENLEKMIIFFQKFLNNFSKNNLNIFSTETYRFNELKEKNVEPNNSWKIIEDLITKKALKNKCGLSILDENCNFIWLDRESNKLFELKIKNLKNESSLYNVFSESSLDKFFNEYRKNNIFSKDKEIIDYKKVSKSEIKSHLLKNNTIENYDVCYKHLRSQAFFFNNFILDDEVEEVNTIENVINYNKENINNNENINILNTNDEDIIDKDKNEFIKNIKKKFINNEIPKNFIILITQKVKPSMIKFNTILKIDDLENKDRLLIENIVKNI